MQEQYFSGQSVESMKEYRLAFFEELKADTRILSDEEYQKVFALAKERFGVNSPACVIPRGLFKRYPHPEIFPLNIKKYLIAINRDSVPDPDFIKYLEIHEHWEVYTAKKIGLNQQEEIIADYPLPIFEQKRPGHRFAILKEFKAAEQDGKLDQYMQWWRTFYQTDIEQIRTAPEEEIQRISKYYGTNGGDRNTIIQYIQNNQKLKEDTYNKLVARRKSTEKK